MSYFNSSLPILDSVNFKKENHINVLSNFRYNEPIEEIKDIYLVKGEFPYMEGIREQSLCTELFFKLKTKEENILSKHMKHIIDLLSDEDKINSKYKSSNKLSIFSKLKLKIDGVSE